MYPTEMAEKYARDAEEKYLKLEKLVRSLLDECGGFNDGCGCCSQFSVRDLNEYKQIEELINQ